MSVEALALVLHHSRATGTDKLVLIGIANHAGDGGAWPTIETLARYANTAERTVQRSLTRLVELGEVAVHRQAGGTLDHPDHARPNRYDVLVACPATCDRTSNHRSRPLPQAQADLWIEGVTPTSPGDAHVTGGVTPTSPGGVTPTSPKPSTEPRHLPSVRYPQTAPAGLHSVPASGDTPPCSRCGAANLDVCRARDALVPVEDRHTYQPAHRSA